MLQSSYAYWPAGKAVAPNHDLAVTDKYSGAVVTRVAQADASAIDAAIRAAVDAAPAMRVLPSYARADV